MNESEYERLIFESLKGFNASNFTWTDFGTIFDPPEEEEAVRVLYKGSYGYIPLDDYIDGGIILKEGITIPRVFMDDCSYEEWQQINSWTEGMQNIVVNEILKDKLLWIYNTVPSITSMPA